MNTKKVTAGPPADEPHRAGWLRMAALGTATVAAAALILPGLSDLPRLTGGPVSTSSESPQASVAPSATLAPNLGATPSEAGAVPWPTVAPSEASVPPSLDGQEFASWTLDDVIPCCGSTLRFSTSTGSPRDTIDIPPGLGISEFWALPAGPVAGRIVYVVDDGRTAQLMVADTGTGAHTELVSTSLLIARLAIDPTGSAAYYLLFDRRTSAFGGLWTVATTGGEPRPLVEAQATSATAILAATRVYVSPQLAISDDGSWIAFVTCHGTGCEFHALRPDAASEPRDWSNFHAEDTIVGIAGNLLIGASECPQARCDGFVLDLRTDERWPLGGADQPFTPKQLIAGPRGPLVLSESESHEQGLWQVEALDLTDGTRSTVFEATFQPGTTIVRLAGGYPPAGAELPPGWFLISRNTDAAPLLPPDYSAGRVGAAVEIELPFMTSSPP